VPSPLEIFSSSLSVDTTLSELVRTGSRLTRAELLDQLSYELFSVHPLEEFLNVLIQIGTSYFDSVFNVLTDIKVNSELSKVYPDLNSLVAVQDVVTRYRHDLVATYGREKTEALMRSVDAYISWLSNEVAVEVQSELERYHRKEVTLASLETEINKRFTALEDIWFKTLRSSFAL
jgi:hypothetical protein